MKFDVMKAVEACYAGACDDRAWLSGLFDAVGPLARQRGIHAQILRIHEDGSVAVESRLHKGVPQDALDEADRFFRSAAADTVRRHWCPSPPVDYCMKRAERIGGPLLEFMRDMARRTGVQDQLGIFAADPGGQTVGIFIDIPVGAPLMPPRVMHQLRGLAAHLTSGLRLQRALRAEGGERLRRADPDEALRIWEGLVDGTWSLVERHEADGKRYLLARRNPPGLREPTALQRNERSVLACAAMGHQNKYISYLLGLSASAVSSRLRSARRKLGLDSRAELIRAFARLAEARPECAAAAREQ